MNLDVQSESSSVQSSPPLRVEDPKQITSPVTYQQLEQTQAAFHHLTCRAARELIPMGTNTRGPAPTAENIRHALAGPNSDRILLIGSNESPMNAFRKLIDYGVQSAPVIDVVTLKSSGLLDLRDLVSLVTLMEEEYQSSRVAEMKLNLSATPIVQTNSGNGSPIPTTSSNTSPNTPLTHAPVPRSPAGNTCPMSPQRQTAPRASPSPSRMRMQTKTVPTLASAPAAIPPHPHNHSHAHPPLPASSSYDSASVMPPTSSSSSMFMGSGVGSSSGLGIPTSSSGGSHPVSASSSFTLSNQNHNSPHAPISTQSSMLRAPVANKPFRSTSPAPAPPGHPGIVTTSVAIAAIPSAPIAPNPNAASNPATYLGQVFNRMSVTRAVDHKPQDFSVTYLAARNRCVTVNANESILSVISVLATTQDVHRVVVTETIDGAKKIVDIISQSDIVKIIDALFGKYLSVNPHSHETGEHTTSLSTPTGTDSELQQSIETLHLGTAPVLSVPADATMFATLQLLSTHKVSGVAVVDRQGRFMGNTSGADLKLYLQSPSSAKLHMKVMDFLSEVRRSSASTNVRTPTVCVSPNASLLYVVAKLTATGMHRVFVVDNVTQAPIAVISVEDIVKLLHKGFPSRRVDRSYQRTYKTYPSTTSSPTASRAGSPSRKHTLSSSAPIRKLSLTASSAGPAVNVGTSYGSSLSPSPSVNGLHTLSAGSIILHRSNSNSMNMNEGGTSPQTPIIQTISRASVPASASNSMSDAMIESLSSEVSDLMRKQSNSLSNGDGNNNSNSAQPLGNGMKL